MRPTAMLSMWLALASLGCATIPAQRVVWPTPPAVERIRLVQTLSGQADIDGPLARLWRTLSGAEAPIRLYHPVGVAVTAQGDLLAVTDQALSQLFLFDFRDGEVRTVGAQVLGGAPVGVAMDGETTWVVVPSRKAALQFSRRGQSLRLVNLDDCDRPVGLAVDPREGKLYASDTSSPTGRGHVVHVHAPEFVRPLESAAPLRWVARLRRSNRFRGERGGGCRSAARRITGRRTTPASGSPDVIWEPHEHARVGAKLVGRRHTKSDALDTGAHLGTLGQRGEATGEFSFPTFLALAPGGGLLVADTMNARVQELDPEGHFVRQFGERGDQVGQFDKPKGIATDAFGNVYVVDSFFSVVQIFNRQGHLLLFFGGRGDSPGFLSNPAGIAIDARNRIYVTNALNFRVDVYELVNTTAADSALGVAGN